MAYTLPMHIDGELAVSTRLLSKHYGRQAALRELNLHVPKGAFYLLVGPNGAGKSTLIKVLLDLVRATNGIAEVLGLNVATHGALVRSNIGYVPERSDWGYGWMTVARLLSHHSRFYPSWDSQYASDLSKAFDVRAEQRVASLSKGQSRRVHLIMALAHRPPLLLLDEPTDGLDPVMRDETLGMLAQHLADTETTVIVSTHHVTEIEQFADHIAVLRDGTLRAQLPLDELRNGLRSYQLQLPSVSLNAPAFAGSVLKRGGAGREVEWTIWGDEADVTNALDAAGMIIRRKRSLSLDEATLTLLASRE